MLHSTRDGLLFSDLLALQSKDDEARQEVGGSKGFTFQLMGQI
jgi:hypothetical protein